MLIQNINYSRIYEWLNLERIEYTNIRQASVLAQVQSQKDDRFCTQSI